jgi:hypothetical protein
VLIGEGPKITEEPVTNGDDDTAVTLRIPLVEDGKAGIVIGISTENDGNSDTTNEGGEGVTALRTGTVTVDCDKVHVAAALPLNANVNVISLIVVASPIPSRVKYCVSAELIIHVNAVPFNNSTCIVDDKDRSTSSVSPPRCHD